MRRLNGDGHPSRACIPPPVEGREVPAEAGARPSCTENTGSRTATASHRGKEKSTTRASSGQARRRSFPLSLDPRLSLDRPDYSRSKFARATHSIFLRLLRHEQLRVRPPSTSKKEQSSSIHTEIQIHTRQGGLAKLSPLSPQVLEARLSVPERRDLDLHGPTRN